MYLRVAMARARNAAPEHSRPIGLNTLQPLTIPGGIEQRVIASGLREQSE